MLAARSGSLDRRISHEELLWRKENRSEEQLLDMENIRRLGDSLKCFLYLYETNPMHINLNGGTEFTEQDCHTEGIGKGTAMKTLLQMLNYCRMMSRDSGRLRVHLISEESHCKGHSTRTRQPG